MKIGTATENEAKLALSFYLVRRFEKEGTFKNSACPEGKEPAYLAASAVMNVVFGEIDLKHSSKELWKTRKATERAYAREFIPDFTVLFASENASRVEKEAERLSGEDRLC